MAAPIVTLPLPYTLVPNTLADADQVMADLNYLATQINANSAAFGTVKVTSASTLLGFLSQIMSAGSGITFTILNPGGAEVLEVSSSAASVQLAQMQAAAVSL